MSNFDTLADNLSLTGLFVAEPLPLMETLTYLDGINYVPNNTVNKISQYVVDASEGDPNATFSFADLAMIADLYAMGEKNNAA